MKKLFSFLCMGALTAMVACSEGSNNLESNTSSPDVAVAAGQSAVQDDVSAKNVVQIAIGSKDHSTLVEAVKAANLVDALSNAGPFTVFAPTNEAFNKLPKGTLESLMKPEKKDDLVDILQYHVSVGVYKENMLTDGQTLGQVNGSNITIGKKDGKITINGNANVIAAIPASNGIVYVVDAVILPPAK